MKFEIITEKMLNLKKNRKMINFRERTMKNIKVEKKKKVKLNKNRILV